MACGAGTWTDPRTLNNSPWTTFYLQLTSGCGSSNQTTLIYTNRMPLAKNASQSLQVPGKSSTRTLQPPSPSQTQQGFVNTPDDSRITLTCPSTPVDGTPAPLSSRLPSPRPPAVKHKIASG
ncbi:hypothetical protein DFH28DRAFT_933525 [Melampsora americana]|nr:hypothetical protein DFH28DRAFT_933525 [Melampsora americana]